MASGHGVLPVDGASLRWEIAGQGPPVVFAHGLGGNHMSWWQQIPAFSRRFTCVVFAHRGFLPSVDATGTPRPECYAGDLLALLDHLGIEKTAIVAQSMGGWTALEFALRWPERVTSLALCGTAGSLMPASQASAARAAGESDLFARGIHPAGGERMAREQPELHNLYRMIASSTGDWDRSVVRDRLHAMRTRRPAEVRLLPHPLLAIAGREDIVVPPSAVEHLASLAPGAIYHPVPEAGHSVYFERAELFNRLVIDFLG